MNAAELFGLDEIVPLQSPVKKIQAWVEQMYNEALAKQREALMTLPDLHEVGYRKGKSAAFHEVLQLLSTGEIPEAATNEDTE